MRSWSRRLRTRYVSPTCLALSHAALGHEDRCRELLGRAEDDRSADYTMYLLGPGFLALYPEWLQRWFEVRRRQVGLLEGPSGRAPGAGTPRAGTAARSVDGRVAQRR